MSREHTGHNNHSLPKTQETTVHMNITRQSISKIRLIMFFVATDGEALYSQQKTRLGVDYGSDHELLLAKVSLNLKTVEKNQ